MTKIWVVALLSVFFVLISVQIITFSKKRSEAAAEFQKTEAALRRAEEDRARLQRELDYYKNPENLEKELRARFNYKSPGEQTIILVPSENAGTSNLPAVFPS